MLQRSETNHAACAVSSFAKHGIGVLLGALAMGVLALASPGMAMAQRPAKPVEIPMTPDWPKRGDRVVKANQIRITRQTKFCVHTWFSPGMRKAVEAYPGYYQSFSSRVVDAGFAYFKKHAFPGNIPTAQIPNQFHGIPSDIDGTNTYCLNDGINVMLTSHVDVSARDEPYKIALVARQGRKVWQHSIERLSEREWPAPNRPGDRLSSSVGLDVMSLTDTFLKQSIGR